MATFAQNIGKIRGDAVYGPEMRTAIADAIMQSVNVDISKEDFPYPDTQNAWAQVQPMETDGDYLLSFQKSS